MVEIGQLLEEPEVDLDGSGLPDVHQRVQGRPSVFEHQIRHDAGRGATFAKDTVDKDQVVVIVVVVVVVEGLVKEL